MESKRPRPDGASQAGSSTWNARTLGIYVKASQAMGDPRFTHVLYFRIDLAEMDPVDMRLFLCHLPFQ